MMPKSWRIVVLVVMSAVCAMAWATSPNRVRTIRKGAKAARAEYRRPAAASVADTLTGELATGRISGYDKPLRSNYETALFSNMTDRRVEQASISMIYRDSKGRMLHSCKLRVNVWVEPGETGQIKWRSWDVQQAYYYHRSRRPRLSAGTSYDAECRIDTLFVSR